jgi:hypothetical protein
MKKEGRGGAGRGQGRKPGSTYLQPRERLWIGSLCEQMQANWENRATFAKYQKRPGTQSTLRAQTLVRGRVPGRRLTNKDDIDTAFRVATEFGLSDLELTRKSIDELRRRKPIRGFVRIAVRRGRTRDQIGRAVSAICKRTRGWNVPPSSVDVYWKEWSAFVRDAKIALESPK